jgi:hypothetical protein
VPAKVRFALGDGYQAEALRLVDEIELKLNYED